MNEDVIIIVPKSKGYIAQQHLNKFHRCNETKTSLKINFIKEILLVQEAKC